MKVIRYNIAKAEEWVKQGVKNTRWTSVGTLVEFHKEDGSVSRIIEIPAIGLKANVFAQRERQEQPTQSRQNQKSASEEIPVIEENYQSPKGEIDAKDIPF